MLGVFALIGWGGTTPGHRPATRLAFIMADRIQTWNGRVWRNCAKKPGEVTIYKNWGRREPTAQQVRRAKMALKQTVA